MKPLECCICHDQCVWNGYNSVVFSFFGLHVNQSTNGYIWGSVRHHDEDDKSPMIHLLT